MHAPSWLKSGILLGLAFFMAVLLAKPVGVTTQFSIVSGVLQNTISNVVQVDNSTGETVFKSSNPYYTRNDSSLGKSIAEPINYEILFVLGVPLGAGLGYWAMKNTRTDDYSNLVYSRNYHIRAFSGGFLSLFGARMADGCTTGHMMSGMMQSSVSGYLFAIAVFAVAIPTAIFFHKER